MVIMDNHPIWGGDNLFQCLFIALSILNTVKHCLHVFYQDILVDLKITEEDFLPLDIKQVKIQFYDELATSLRFYVKKRKQAQSRTLKEITLQNLSFLVDAPASTELLELPRDLAEQLRDEIENCWKSRHILGAQTRGKRWRVLDADRSHRWKAKYFDC